MSESPERSQSPTDPTAFGEEEAADADVNIPHTNWLEALDPCRSQPLLDDYTVICPAWITPDCVK